MCKFNHQWSELTQSFDNSDDWYKRYCKKCDRYEYYLNGKFDFAVDLADPKHPVPKDRNKPE